MPRDPKHAELDHHRESSDGEYAEWSCDSTGCIEQNKPSRIFLRVDIASDFTISEDLVTSKRKEARELNSTSQAHFDLTPNQARWLAEVLPLAIAKLEEMERDSVIAQGVCPNCGAPLVSMQHTGSVHWGWTYYQCSTLTANAPLDRLEPGACTFTHSKFDPNCGDCP